MTNFVKCLFCYKTAASRAVAIRTFAGPLLVLMMLAGCGNARPDPPGPGPVSIEEAPEEGRQRPPAPLPEALAPRLQLLFTRCEDGDLAACRELAVVAPPGSTEQRFGAACGNRDLQQRCA